MKKRVLLSAFTIFLLLCMLVGCGADAVQTSSLYGESQTETETESESETSSDITLPPDDLPAEETDFFTEHGHGELPDTAVIPAVCEPTDTEHLYTFPIGLPDADGLFAQTSGDVLQLSYWTEENRCSFYSLTTGELLYELTLPAWGATGTLDGGGFWCVDFSVFEVAFYDAQGEKRVPIAGESPDVNTLSPYDASVTPDGRYLLVLYTEGDPIVLFDLQNGTQTAVQTESEDLLWSIRATEHAFYLRTGNGGVLCIDCESGTAKKYYPGREFGTFYGDLCQFSMDGCLVLGNADPDSERFYAALEDGESLYALAFGCAATGSYHQSGLYRFYDLRNGVRLSELTLADDGYGAQISFLQNGAVLILKYAAQGTSVYLYDLPAAAERTDTVETLLFTDRELADEIDRMASETEQATGVDLLYGSEGNDFSVSDYVGAVEKDLYTVYRSVETVSEILSRYPEGMLEESYKDTHRGLQIYLCGDLYGTSSDVLSQAGGLTTEKDGYIIVVLDVYNNLQYTLPHELSHVFDRRISHVSSGSERNWMTLWELATPMEDAYIYTYNEYQAYPDYTAWYEADESRVWFVDSYARTFPTEDRARIMEHLFNPAEDGLAQAFQYENLQAKARLYCYMLRCCFETCDTEEPLYWETYLDGIDESVIPQ